MEATKHIVILLVLILLTSAPAQSANRPAATDISNTRTASCVVKITSDPMVLPLDNTTIDYLLHSTGIGGRVAREVLNISPDQVSDIFKIEALAGGAGRILPEDRRQKTDGRGQRPELLSSGFGLLSSEQLRAAAEQTILFKLQVDLPEEVKPVAEEFMNALVGNLRNTLIKAFEDYKLRFGDQLKLAEQEATSAETDLREKQKTLREISRSRVLDHDKILADIYRLRQNVQTAKMNQASNQVIIDTTTRRIAETQAKIMEHLENDSITIELQKIVELIGRLLIEAEKQFRAGTISSLQLNEIKEKLARARIEIAIRRESLSNSIGGNLIESLNKELADRSITAAQDEASIRSLERQLVEAESLFVKADDYELFSLKADVAKQTLQESILWRDRTSRRIRFLQSPMVSILGVE
ncbi:MAG: hypothetical protein IIB56_16765 [Planctomycetes bacterium]|nr:hypothetical protein [Planctomycetota bacterium]